MGAAELCLVLFESADGKMKMNFFFGAVIPYQ
jgi:hypothetical protein